MYPIALSFGGNLVSQGTIAPIPLAGLPEVSLKYIAMQWLTARREQRFGQLSVVPARGKLCYSK